MPVFPLYIILSKTGGRLSNILDTASAGDYDALTDKWLCALNGDVSYDDMTAVLSLLHSKEEEELAKELLELTIAEKETDGEAGFSVFLENAAGFIRECEPLRKALIESIRDDNLMFQPLEYFLKLSGFKKINADVHKSWRAFNCLMKYRKDGYLHHGTFGVGQIKRMSRTYATIDFQKAQNHNMKLDVVLESTKPLSSSSLAILSWRNPDDFTGLFRNNQSDFLKRLAEEPLGKPGEIRLQDLSVFSFGTELTESEAWKILRKMAASTDGFADLGDRIVLLDENVEFLERIRKIILRRKEPIAEKAKQIQALLKSCCSSFPDVLPDLLQNLREISSPETGSMFELSWILTDRGTLPEFSDIKFENLESTAARAERALGEIRSQACRKEYLKLFFSGNADRKEKIILLSRLRRVLWEHAAAFLEQINPQLLSECIGDYLSKPSETDRFLWALTFLASREDYKDEKTGYNQMSIFLDNLIFSSADTQKKVINLLAGPLKVTLDSYLSSIDIRKLGEYLDRFNTSATAQNEGLCLIVGREISRRKNSSFGKPAHKHFWETDALYSSLGAIQQLEADIIRLKQIEIPAAAEAIGEAASHGDLSENAEYSAAIEKRDLLLDKHKRWTGDLQKYRAYPFEDISPDIVGPGIRVKLQESGGSETVYTIDIVGPLDAEPEEGRINYKAPLGITLLGKSLGDMVVLPGEDTREWRIASLEVLDLSKL